MDLGFGFLWRVEKMGGNVGGLLIISGAFLRLSACLGDAPGERCGLLVFMSIFPFIAWPLMRGMQCSVSHLSMAVFGFTWYSFQLSTVSGF